MLEKIKDVKDKKVKNVMTDKRSIQLLLVGIIVGSLIGMFVKDFIAESFTANFVEVSVKKFYELALPGSSVSVENIKKDGDFYKVLVKIMSNNANPQYIEVWVSKDGKILAETVIYLQDSIQNIQKYKAFVECLNSKGVRIYGVLDSNSYPNEAALSLQQLNLLGRYSYLIFISCDGDLINNCRSIGINSFPSIVYENRIYQGPLTAEQLSQLTGCKI